MQTRKRLVPHAPGQYASLVSVPLDINHELADSFCNILDEIENITGKSPIKASSTETSTGPLDKDQIIAIDPGEIHLSVSKLFMLHGHLVNDIPMMIQKEIKSKMSPFSLKIKSFAILSNDDNSRHFLVAIPSDASKWALHKLTKIVDQLIQPFGLPIYYEEALFHFSIAWSLSREAFSDKLIQHINESFIEPDDPYIVDHLSIKVGKSEHKIQFAQHK